MLKWNKDKNKYDIIKNNKFSRHDMMDKDSETIFKFMAGVAFFILLISVVCILQAVK